MPSNKITTMDKPNLPSLFTIGLIAAALGVFAYNEWPTKVRQLAEIETALVANEAAQRDVVANAIEREANQRADQIRFGFDARAAQTAHDANAEYVVVAKEVDAQLLRDLNAGRARLLEKKRAIQQR